MTALQVVALLLDGLLIVVSLMMLAPMVAENLAHEPGPLILFALFLAVPIVNGAPPSS